MFRVSITTTCKKNVAQNFLEFAVRNYLSARILYLNNQLYDAGVMSHEAFEKIMKALLYFKDPSLDLSSQHNLTNLINSLIGRFRVHDLKGSHDLFEYYENCYAYRYPDDNQPKSFSTSTDHFKSLDNIFFYFHEECLKEIANDEIKYLTGIFTEATHYFKSNDRQDLYKIIQSNDCFTLEYINVAKDYWHEKGYYLKDANGVTLYPNGSVTREH
jgi:HEPN domain-containing protein